MHKLFSLSYRRILNRLAVEELKPSTVVEVLDKNSFVKAGEGLLYRLPR